MSASNTEEYLVYAQSPGRKSIGRADMAVWLAGVVLMVAGMVSRWGQVLVPCGFIFSTF